MFYEFLRSLPGCKFWRSLGICCLFGLACFQVNAATVSKNGYVFMTPLGQANYRATYGLASDAINKAKAPTAIDSIVANASGATVSTGLKAKLGQLGDVAFTVAAFMPQGRLVAAAVAIPTALNMLDSYTNWLAGAGVSYKDGTFYQTSAASGVWFDTQDNGTRMYAATPELAFSAWKTWVEAIGWGAGSVELISCVKDASTTGYRCSYKRNGVAWSYRLISRANACADGSTPADSGACGVTSSAITNDQAITLLNTHTLDQSLVKAILQTGTAIQVDDDAVTVTGPASVTTGTSTTTGPTGTSTTKSNTPITYEGNKITIGPTTTTTTNVDVGGDTTTTTTVVQNDTPEDDTSECEKSPDSLGCAELDTPEQEIPRDTEDVTLDTANQFGGGACVPDVTFNFSSGHGGSATWSMQTPCDMIASYVRPMVILLCTFGALMIILPGRESS